MEVVELFDGDFQNIRKKRLVLFTHGLVWVVVAGFTSLLLSWVLFFQYAILFSFFHVALLAGVYYFNIYLVNKLIEQRRYSIYILLFILLFLCIVVLRAAFNITFFENVPILKTPVKESWTYLFSVFTTLMVLLLSFFNGLLVTRSKKEREYELVISQQQEAQLQFLKAQMSPHFLFNSLNNIYSLTIDKAPRAAEMLLLLSELLRYAVYESKKDKVSIESEIKQIEKFIKLYQMKSEAPLPISFQVTTSSPTLFIEPMILIPLVENCFKHCNLDTYQNAFINIQLSAAESEIQFETVNSKDEWEKSTNDAGGVGLKNIKQRLLLLYPNRHSLIVNNEPHQFKLKLTLSV